MKEGLRPKKHIVIRDLKRGPVYIKMQDGREVTGVLLNQFIPEQHMKEMINRYGGVTSFVNTLSLGEFPFSISIYEKLTASGGRDEVNKLITNVDLYGKSIGVLPDCYLDSQSFQLSNDGIAGLNSSGRYLTPLTFKQI